jgi:hypothetical protein
LGKYLITIFQPLAAIVSGFALRHFPAEAAQLLQVPEQYHAFSLFSLLAINVVCGKKYHLDRRDESICVVVPAGKYQKGALGFSELDIGMILRPGDFAIFYGRDYYHSVSKFVGDRMSFVFMTKQKTAENGRQILEDTKNKIDSYAVAYERHKNNK